MQITIDIDPALLEELRLEATRCGMTVNALVNAALRAGLAIGVTESTTPYRVKTASLGAPRTELDHALQLSDALEDEDRRRH